MNPSNDYLNQLQEKYGHRIFSKKGDVSPTATYIGRGSIYGNKYTHIPNISNTVLVANRTVAVLQYRSNLIKEIKKGNTVLIEAIKDLKNKNVICYCNNGSNRPDPEKYCHGLILLAACDYLNNQR